MVLVSHGWIQKILLGEGVMTTYFSHQCIPQRVVRTSLEKQKNGSNCFSKGSVPVFIRKSLATSDFPGGGGGLDPLPQSLDPPMYQRGCYP